MLLFIAIVCLVATILHILTNRLLYRLRISKITDRYVFITGCDTGFGNILARKLDNLGVNVIAGCLTENGQKDLQHKSSTRLKTVLLDVTNKESVKKAYEFVKDNTKDHGLWGVVNNAGILKNYGPFELTPLEDYEAVINVNFLGTVSVCHAFLPLLRQSRGRLVNVCSTVADTSLPGLSDYVAAKSAAKMFSACLRREFYKSGLTVHIVEPGVHNTNLVVPDRICDFAKNAVNSSSDEQKKFYGGNLLKRAIDTMQENKKTLQNPENVADAMVHALLGKYPKLRYIIGYDANTFFRVMALVPDWIADRVIGWPEPYGELQ